MVLTKDRLTILGALPERCTESISNVKCLGCGERFSIEAWIAAGGECTYCQSIKHFFYSCERCSGRFDELPVSGDHPCHALDIYENSGKVVFEDRLERGLEQEAAQIQALEHAEIERRAKDSEEKKECERARAEAMEIERSKVEAARLVREKDKLAEEIEHSKAEAARLAREKIELAKEIKLSKVESERLEREKVKLSASGSGCIVGLFKLVFGLGGALIGLWIATSMLSGGNFSIPWLGNSNSVTTARQIEIQCEEASKTQPVGPERSAFFESCMASGTSRIRAQERISRERSGESNSSVGTGASESPSPPIAPLALQEDLSKISPTEETKATPPKATSSGKLPPCLGGDSTTWTNCVGQWVMPDGTSFSGEWKDGKPSPLPGVVPQKARTSSTSTITRVEMTAEFRKEIENKYVNSDPKDKVINACVTDILVDELIQEVFGHAQVFDMVADKNRFDLATKRVVEKFKNIDDSDVKFQLAQCVFERDSSQAMDLDALRINVTSWAGRKVRVRGVGSYMMNMFMLRNNSSDMSPVMVDITKLQSEQKRRILQQCVDIVTGCSVTVYGTVGKVNYQNGIFAEKVDW